jgi:hypothetical protein
MGRARLASSTALALLVDKLVLTPEEVRQQMIADGLINISIPEKIPAELKNKQVSGAPTSERPALLGKPVAPSQGGYGEVRSEIVDWALDNDTVFRSIYDQIENVFEELPEETQILIGQGLQRYLHKYSVDDDILDEMGLLDDNLEKSIIDEELEYGTERPTTQDEAVGIANP